MKQREIKFRAWDGKHMTTFSLEIDSSGELNKLPHRHQDFPYLNLMQYTGLKDKNGKEIYEGDVVRSKEGKFGYVVYLETNCRFIVLRELVGYTVPQYQFELAFPREPGILGNKWEHPDLLK